MRHHIIWWINVILGALSAAAIVAAIYFLSITDREHVQPPLAVRSTVVPTPNFGLKPAHFAAVGEPALILTYATPKLRVPDLRNVLNFIGRDMRPDASMRPKMFFTLGNARDVMAAAPGEKIYLHYTGAKEAPYTFSPENRPTSLWFQASGQGNRAEVQMQIVDEEGQLQKEPPEHSKFTLPEKPLPAAAAGWMMDKWRVDGTLLARQRGHWSGRDLFLERHGGDEFQHLQGKQRIEFGEGDAMYAVYVDKNDSLIWKDGRWQLPEAQENTKNYPMLKVLKTDERILSFELFDLEGKRKLLLNLVKSADTIPAVNVENDFQFIGARTRVHFMFKINKQRQVVGVQDWFLLTPEGWNKLTTSKDIDSYASGELRGPLLVIDAIENQDLHKALSATLFSPGRSEAVPMEIPLNMVEKPQTKEAPPQVETPEE